MPCLQKREAGFLHDEAVHEAVASAEVSESVTAQGKRLIDAGTEHHFFHDDTCS
ncbi:putative predicted protein [Rhizobium favelukesii]|uniref:Uncharacterized protein n=1 Tax=Rhizobium favelukesii TaxID=348824 RepID=W6RG20_9HYPH|nr:putative predicted protein [Rhizobium favelukesii]